MGGKTSTTTQQVQIPQDVLDRYNSINAQAQSAANTPFQQYSTDPSAFVAQLNQQQQTGINNVNASAGAYQPYFANATSATQAGMASADPGQLNIDQYMNPFQQNVINTTMDRMRQEQEQQQSGALGTAISSGAFGGDRAGIAAANLAQQQNMATGSTLAGLNAQNFSQAMQTAQQQQGLQLGAEQANLARLLSGGQQMAGLGQAAQAAGLQGAEAQINAGTLGQQTEQAGLSALYNQFQQQQAYPFQVAQFLANIGMGTGALSGSTTTTTQPAAFWSDRRLKHDIKRIGKTDEGMPIYKFKYKGDDKDQTHIGFMADEVEEHHPEAVGVAPNGYKYVDYDRATKAEGGGVAGPYGSSVGSQPGAGSYVPQAYLPVGDLMVADSSGLANAQSSIAQQIAAAAALGENLSSLRSTLKSAKDMWGNKDREDAVGAAASATGVSAHANGGATGYADGGSPAYLSAGLAAGQNPVEKENYLSDTVKSQEEGKKNQLMQPSAPPQQQSGLSAIADIAKLGSTLMGFFNQGGGVRPGYAEGGTPEEERSRLLRLLAQDVPKPQTLGSLPDAPVVPASEPAGVAAAQPPMPVADLTGLASAAINRSDVKPMPGPSPEVSAGLAPAKAETSNVDPREFFNNNILKQESGNRQFDRNGNPLTSSAGAVGIAQIMEGTGPEAAKLAGLDWDRDRWLNDADYNKALGEAYFLEMYRQFGSVDRAAAAYNAGPGRLRSAIDRATAMGGSYTDYLPEETRNYVASTTGMGLTPSAASSPESAGVAGGRDAMPTEARGALGLAPDKAYADRTTLGKMFYNPDGSVNRDALVSIASGVGSMLSSPSQFLLPSIGLGLQGAASTYAGLEAQRADLSGKNLENMRKVAMDTMQWNELNGTSLTPAQYAKMSGINIAFPEAATAQDILSGAYQPSTGDSGLKKLNYGEFQDGSVEIGGRTVRMQDDPASLQRFILDNSWAPADSPIGMAVANARSQLQRIDASGGMTVDARTGEQFQIPGYTAVGDTQAQAASNREATSQFRTSGIERMPVISQQLMDTDKQAMIFTQLEAGALTNELTSASAVLEALGLPVPEGAVADRGLAQQAIKLAASKMIGELGNLPGGAPAAELDRLSQIAADPNLQPEAVKMILTMQKASLLRERDRYAMRNQWASENPGSAMDQYAYEQWFDQNRPYTSYYEEAKKSMPLFAGEEVTVENAPDGTTDIDQAGRPIVKRNGKWELQ